MWPLMFITIACGAVSGFHATQSPMMARCLPSEKYGRGVFYGSMIAEGVIALIWATLAISFFHTPRPERRSGQRRPRSGGQRGFHQPAGQVGGISPSSGVVVLPITSGDTAFRSARLSSPTCSISPRGSRGSGLSSRCPFSPSGFSSPCPTSG
jgi:hypothetical protein